MWIEEQQSIGPNIDILLLILGLPITYFKVSTDRISDQQIVHFQGILEYCKFFIMNPTNPILMVKQR